MSALDLFAMLNAPLTGNGAAAPASRQAAAGQGDDAAQGAFAGLLAMLVPQRDGAQTAAAMFRDEVAQAPFRSAAPTSFPGLADAPADGDDVDPWAEADDADDILQAAPGAPPSTQTPPAASPSPSASASPSPSPSSSSSPLFEAASAPMEGSSGSPATAAQPVLPEMESPPTFGQAPASTGDEAESGAPVPGVMAAAVSTTTATAAQTAHAGQTTPQPQPKSQPSAAPALPAGDAAPETTPEAIRPAGTAGGPAPAEAARVAAQVAASAIPPASELSRLAQPPRAEPAASTDRPSQRRDGESRTALVAAAETGEPSRPSVAASAQAPAASTTAPTPRSGAALLEVRAEPAPAVMAPAAPDGEAAPEPVRTADSQTATSSIRDHLPSARARAGAETTAMLSAQIVRRLETRTTRFDMVLTPEDLGRVDVRMEVDSDGQLTARLAFDNPAAAAELRGRADELRRQLEAAGFQMSEGSLEFAERDGGRRDAPLDRRERAFGGAGRLAETADALPPPARWMSLSLTPEGVDMKV